MEEERQIVEPDVDALDLIGALVAALFLDPHAFQGEGTREWVQVQRARREDTPGELGNLRDRDTAHDPGQPRQEQPSQRDHRQEDADQDLARAAGDAEHRTSRYQLRGLVAGALHTVVERVGLPRFLNRDTTNVEETAED